MPLKDVKLSHLFEIMEQNKEKFHIEDYSLSQTTLDEVPTMSGIANWVSHLNVDRSCTIILDLGKEWLGDGNY